MTEKILLYKTAYLDPYFVIPNGDLCSKNDMNLSQIVY